jgi:hypothetical protein
LLDAQNKVLRRTVKLGALFGDLRAVDSGIVRDDWVIIDGTQRAEPGATVAPQRGVISDASLNPFAGSAATQALPATRMSDEVIQRAATGPATRPAKDRTPDVFGAPAAGGPAPAANAPSPAAPRAHRPAAPAPPRSALPAAPAEPGTPASAGGAAR